MKNKFEVLEDRAFYTDSVYFEIINDLVKIDSKIEKLSVEYKNEGNDKIKIFFPLRIFFPKLSSNLLPVYNF